MNSLAILKFREVDELEGQSVVWHRRLSSIAAITKWAQQSLGRQKARTTDQTVMRGWEKEDETPGRKGI